MVEIRIAMLMAKVAMFLTIIPKLLTIVSMFLISTYVPVNPKLVRDISCHVSKNSNCILYILTILVVVNFVKVLTIQYIQ